MNNKMYTIDEIKLYAETYLLPMLSGDAPEPVGNSMLSLFINEIGKDIEDGIHGHGIDEVLSRGENYGNFIFKNIESGKLGCIRTKNSKVLLDNSKYEKWTKPCISNGSGEYCPKCGSPEVDAMTPRTTYGCGSSDYDQRPETFTQSQTCILSCLPKLSCPKCWSDIIYNDRHDQEKGVHHCDDCGHEDKLEKFYSKV